ncbi:6259_t:CDS:2, partial [Racocetra persica]
LDNTGSYITKEEIWNEGIVVIKNRYDSINDLKTFLSTFNFPCESYENILRWLIGRVGFSTSFIEEWFSSTYNIVTLFEKFKQRYTDPTHNESIMVRIIQSTDSEFVRRGVERDNLGGFQVTISEPLVIESAISYFKKFRNTSTYILDKMIDETFEDSNAHILFKKKLPFENWKIYEPCNNNRKLCVQSMRCTPDFNLPKFLENPVVPFFFPENEAGPDIVTFVHPVGMPEKRFITFVQVKLREKHSRDDLITTDPKKFYHKRKGTCQLLKGECYKNSYEKVLDLIHNNYCGVFRIFISYPALVALKEENLEIENSSFDNVVEDWIALIFDDEHIKILKDLKNPKRKAIDSNS